ncbi:transglycosylase SLT domain-containing protein [Sphingomonas histidinilytica]|uniref:lytic transglycosylase domain-containing protein n=1 Tax=Rhizorhabdus histidinilytica TaxID=439228 RepID=UPI001ADAABFD|nr:lytic transglycosylase domain-containing protein [Rhizorhabdus histidinilytica]MBO9378089.1 transglycosylase SLT domain-containing protein [Rhizorhabdus histidinilytica]
MRVRFASRCRSCAVRLAGASALTGTLASLFPATTALATPPAAASIAHPYTAHVAEAAQRFGIPEAWIWAVMRAESNGDPAAVSRAGAMGLMQIMPGTWGQLTARYGLGDNPWDVRANIHAGAAYLREMVDRYRDLSTALAAYNAGPGRVDDWRQRGRPLPAETIAYVAKLAPTLGTSGIASPAVVPAVPRAAAAPSWRDAGLFVLRGDGALGGSETATDPGPVAQPDDIASAPVPSPSGLPPRPSSPGLHGLFVSLSGRSEQ